MQAASALAANPEPSDAETQPLAAAQDQAEIDPAVEDFVSKVYIHGLPSAEARRFGSDAVPTLIALLNNESYRAYWPNVTTMLGYVGGDDAAAALINFVLEDRPQSQNRSVVVAKQAAVYSLGYMSNLARSDIAYSFLSEAASPAWWLERDIPWARTLASTRGGQAAVLAAVAMSALPLSGRPSATERLEELRSAVDAPDMEQFREVIGPVLDEAILKSRQIQSEGLQLRER
jgi:hypothetical protein